MSKRFGKPVAGGVGRKPIRPAWAGLGSHYVAVLSQLADYCTDMAAQSRLGALEYHLVHIVFGEYLNRLPAACR